MGFKIKNWDKFQHFKDRRPPWVKLYRDLLDDPEWFELDSESSKCLVMLWLIASEDDKHEGRLPDVKTLAFRMRTTEDKVKQQLTKVSHWLEQDDISVISDRYQVGPPETETETETETEKRQKTPPSASHVFTLPEWINQEMWELWMKTRKGKKMIPEQMQAQVNKLAKWRASGLDYAKALSDAATAGWQGLFEPAPIGQLFGNQQKGQNRYERIADNIAKLTGRDKQREPSDDPGIIHGTATRLD